MATGIVSTAAERLRLHALSIVLVAVAAATFVVLVVLLGIRLAKDRQRLAAHWRQPRTAFAFLTFVAAATVLGERLDELGLATPALLLVAVGIVSWAVLTYAVQLTVMLAARKQPAAEALDGTWLLWVVATQSLATAAAMVGVHERALSAIAAAVAVCAWGAGGVLYIVLIVMILARLLLLPIAPRDLEPSYWIGMGATAITVLAGARILNLPRTMPVIAAATPTVVGFSLLLWAFGTWMLPALVAITVGRHVGAERLPVTYEAGLWSMVFPLGMYSAASMEFGGAARLPFMSGVGVGAGYVAIATWVAVTAMWAWSVPTTMIRRAVVASPAARSPRRGASR
jgi:tellurite resistance protein TehA-like permease